METRYTAKHRDVNGTKMIDILYDSYPASSCMIDAYLVDMYEYQMRCNNSKPKHTVSPAGECDYPPTEAASADDISCAGRPPVTPPVKLGLVHVDQTKPPGNIGKMIWAEIQRLDVQIAAYGTDPARAELVSLRTHLDHVVAVQRKANQKKADEADARLRGNSWNTAGTQQLFYESNALHAVEFHAHNLQSAHIYAQMRQQQKQAVRQTPKKRTTGHCNQALLMDSVDLKGSDLGFLVKTGTIDEV